MACCGHSASCLVLIAPNAQVVVHGGEAVTATNSPNGPSAPPPHLKSTNTMQENQLNKKKVAGGQTN